MMDKPHGRRHDAFTDYHQRIQMGDDSHGYDAEAVSSLTRFITKDACIGLHNQIRASVHQRLIRLILNYCPCPLHRSMEILITLP